MSQEGAPFFDLSLASTDDLIEELKARYPFCVFAGLRDALGDKTAQERICKWYGCTPTVIGLLEITKKRILARLFEETEPIEDEEL